MNDRLGLMIIRDTTSLGFGPVGNTTQEFDYIQQALPGVDPTLIESFQARNTQPFPLEDHFNLSVPVKLLNQDDFDAFFGKTGKGWDAFYAQYPGSEGVLTLSKVGFNARGDKALVYAGSMSNTLAGAGYAVLLELEDGQWQFVIQVELWIS